MTRPNFSLEGRVALVTGVGRGIGKEIALTFAEAGADVALCDIDPSGLGSTAEEIRALGKQALTLQADVSRKADVDSMVDKAVKEFGALDILVNNAGIYVSRRLLEFAEDDWDKIMDINVKSCFLCTQAAGKVMAERKRGNIINISSVAAIRAATITGSSEGGVYAITKTAVAMLTKTAALELAPHNIRVNAIGPGAVTTEITRNSPNWTIPERREKALLKIPLRRRAETSDIAHTALFLASDASSYITGQILFVDGGMLANC